jgi:predicted AAA+ superfamily ATPase
MIYLDRILDARIDALLKELPALMIVGPRAVGKTTTASRHAASLVSLDRPAQAAVFRADPDVALGGLAEPVLIDEWQEVPEVLGALKRSVDADARPGRFILTGSVRADLEAQTWPGTGRVVRLAMHGLTVREHLGEPMCEGFLDTIMHSGVAHLAAVRDAPDLRGYIDLSLRSGFPPAALDLSPTARRAWLAGYIDQLITRDADAIQPGRDPSRMRRWLTAFATVSGKIVEDKTLWEAAGINRRTAIAYERLLTNLFVVDAIPAWSSNRLKRLVRRPKRYVVDPALGAALIGVGSEEVLRDGDVLGCILDTFVVSQLRAEAALRPDGPKLHHLREEGGGREVDLIAESPGGKIIGIEVKATSSPNVRDARHLKWLRDQLGALFVGGVVLHTGPRGFMLDERIAASPIAALWS